MGLHTAAIYVSSYILLLYVWPHTELQAKNAAAAIADEKKKQKATADEKEKITESTPLLHGSPHTAAY